jgi:hypothetical protein
MAQRVKRRLLDDAREIFPQHRQCGLGKQGNVTSNRPCPSAWIVAPSTVPPTAYTSG